MVARKQWDLKPVQDRAQVLLKAADLLSGPRRAEVLAKTMIGQVRSAVGGSGGVVGGATGRCDPVLCLFPAQGKTVVQAEIDAAAELIDFFRFNAKHAVELEQQQPLDAQGSSNTMLYRGLEVRLQL